MVHMANCGPGTTGAMFYNIDQIVGAGGPRGLNADTQLVQWMLSQLGFLDGTRFSGENDAETIDAITQFQLANGPFPPDGRVSIAHGTTFGSQHSPYNIVRLNFQIREKFRFSGWPAINKIPGAPMAPKVFGRIAELLGNDSRAT